MSIDINWAKKRIIEILPLGTYFARVVEIKLITSNGDYDDRVRWKFEIEGYDGQYVYSWCSNKFNNWPTKLWGYTEAILGEVPEDWERFDPEPLFGARVKLAIEVAKDNKGRDFNKVIALSGVDE